MSQPALDPEAVAALIAEAEEYENNYADYLASKDADTVAVYEAESEFYEWHVSCWPGHEDLTYCANEALTAAQAEGEAVEVLRRAGYENPQVAVELVVLPAEIRSGFYDPVRNVIGGFVEPIGISRRVLLHELAHWMRPHVGHGPQFRSAHATLIGIVFGQDTALELVANYEYHDLPIEESWFAESQHVWADLRVGAA